MEFTKEKVVTASGRQPQAPSVPSDLQFFRPRVTCRPARKTLSVIGPRPASGRTYARM